MIEIKNRFTGKVIATGETLHQAVKGDFADLWSADFRNAYLRSINLRGVSLRNADFRDANLWGANLRNTDLWGANLQGANLRDADFRGANLRNADLRNAKIAWQSHDLLSEILRRAAGNDIAKLKIAGLILLCQEKCWSNFLEIRDPLSGWALSTLHEWVQDDDGAPDEVRNFSK